MISDKFVMFCFSHYLVPPAQWSVPIMWTDCKVWYIHYTLLMNTNALKNQANDYG